MHDFKNILDEMEMDRLAKFAEDEMTMQAVKKFILSIAYKHGVIEKGKEHQGNLNYALNMAWGAINPNGMPRTDKELGQNLRALAQAVSLVESGFKEIREIKEVVKAEQEKPKTKKKTNEAE